MVHGAPGDVICAIGNAMMHESWRDRNRFLYYGYDAAVPEFIRAQSFCEECVAVIEKNPHQYAQSVQTLCIKVHPTDEGYYPYLRQFVLPKTGIKPEQLHLVLIGEMAKREYRIHRWKNPKLPDKVRAWAKDRFIDDGKRSYLLHPTSWQSNDVKRHWPNWTDAILWLLQEHPQLRFYLTGQDYPHRFVSDNLVNLVDQTPTFMEPMAIADLCSGIISTTNNLSHYAVLTDKPSVACCVWGMSQPWYYFRKWVDVLPIRLVEFRDPLSEFKARCNDLFAITRFGPHAWKPENNPGTFALTNIFGM